MAPAVVGAESGVQDVEQRVADVFVAFASSVAKVRSLIRARWKEMQAGKTRVCKHLFGWCEQDPLFSRSFLPSWKQLAGGRVMPDSAVCTIRRE